MTKQTKQIQEASASGYKWGYAQGKQAEQNRIIEIVENNYKLSLFEEIYEELIKEIKGEHK